MTSLQFTEAAALGQLPASAHAQPDPSAHQVCIWAQSFSHVHGTHAASLQRDLRGEQMRTHSRSLPVGWTVGAMTLGTGGKATVPARIVSLCLD